MECTRWEKEGLLVTSGELDEGQAREFRKHTESCPTCRAELDAYERMKQHLLAPGVLCETPSASLDSEILRVCSTPPGPTASFAFLPLFVRRAVLSALFLAVGFGGGAYFRGIRAVSREREASERIAGSATAPAPQVAGVSSPAADSADSVSGHGGPDSQAVVENRGNLSLQGIVPVDLANE